MHVLGNHQLVGQVEGRWIDPALQDLQRFDKIRAIVANASGVGQFDGHPVPAAGAGPAAVVHCA